LALASLWLALRYSCEGGAIFLVFSGFMYAAALLIHPLLAYFGLPIAVALVGPPPQFLPLQESPKLKHRAKRTKPCGLNSAPRDATKLLDMGPGRWSLLLFAAVVGGCVLLALAFVDQRAFLDWVVGSNYSALDTEVTILEQDNWALVLEYLCQNCILLGMAVLGAVVTWAFGRTSRGAHTCGASARWVVAVWLFATLLTLLLWSPLWEHYLLFLALPLVALAGVGFAMGGKLLLSKPSQLSLPASGTSLLSLWPRVGLSALLLGGGCLFLVDRIRTPLPQSAGGLAWSGDRMAARAFLAASVPRGGFVMTDDPFLAFAEGYLVPPALTEASYKQFRTGRLTVEDLIVSALRYKAQAVLIASGRFDLVPAFERWASLVASERQIFGDICTYWWEPPVAAPHVVMEHLKREGGGDALAFVNPVPLDDLWEVPPLSVEAGMTLGDDIILLGAVLEPTVGGLKPGQPFTVTLVWRAEGWIDQSYHVFLHLLDADGVLVTQSDGLPARGTQPTLAWLPGEVVLDQRVLTLPEAVPGIYTL